MERLTVGSTDWMLYGAEHIARYEFARTMVAGLRVLDCGCGPGYGAAMLKDAGAAEVIAIDIDPATVDEARSNFGANGCEFRVEDAHTLATFADGSLDVVVSFENIEHLPRPAEFVRAAARVLRPGGVLICSTPDRASTPPFQHGKPANPFHMNEWYRDEFRDLLASAFGQIDLRVQTMTYGLRERRVAVQHLRQLSQEMRALLQNPLVRVVRTIGRWCGVPHLPLGEVPESAFEAIEPGHVADFGIHGVGISSVYGKPRCHVAICRLS